MPGKLQILPLGGATEIGKNMYAYRVDGKILVVDCGVKFPEAQQLGVDLLIPDISYLLQHREQVLGFVLTQTESPAHLRRRGIDQELHEAFEAAIDALDRQETFGATDGDEERE